MNGCVNRRPFLCPLCKRGTLSCFRSRKPLGKPRVRQLRLFECSDCGATVFTVEAIYRSYPKAAGKRWFAGLEKQGDFA